MSEHKPLMAFSADLGGNLGLALQKKHPFVRALGIYMTMQITIMTQTGLILMILVFRYNAAGEYCSKGALK